MIFSCIVGGVRLPNRSSRVWKCSAEHTQVMASPGQEVFKDMYAIIETGGKQYKVQEGDILSIEKLNASEGETVEISNVLAVVTDGNLVLGKPLVEGAKAVLKVLEHGKGEKVIVFKYKPKKDYRKIRGHRQPFTRVVVEKILVQ